ncbi:aspartate/glutamate racemase family protein [Saccharopolyspora sp. NPDC050642]|uniref:aspartate/glutamate racemase family protein n=1 Tax=Saccharopolyspora sp. NPDC050642 TaxID=3157099 RepID=UPI0033D237AE
MSTPETGRILLVNPNTNRATTEMMRALAARSLRGSGLDVDGITAAAGPSMIVDPVALKESESHVHDAVLRALDAAEEGGRRYLAVIVAAIGDPGRGRLDEELDLPVVGIGQAAIRAAGQAGRRFGMATSTPLLVDSLAAQVAEHGMSEGFTGVRLTESEPLVLAADPERQFAELAAAVDQCTAADGADAVIIAGGPLSETARRIADSRTCEIVEPIPSAARQVLQELGLSGV